MSISRAFGFFWFAPGIRGHAVGYSRSTRAISSSALGRSVPLSGSDVDAASYVSSFDVVVPMALSRSSLSLSALYCVEKLRAKPAGDGARADDAGFGGPPRATDTASPALYDDAGWVNPTERPSMRGRHCAGLTGCNTKNCPIRKTSQENRRNGNAFLGPVKTKLFSGYERKRPIRRQRSTLPTAPWRGGGGGWSDIRREGECRIARRSKIYFASGLTRRWERRCSTASL